MHGLTKIGFARQALVEISCKQFYQIISKDLGTDNES
jgi:hypothetical protein